VESGYKDDPGPVIKVPDDLSQQLGGLPTDC